MLFLCPLTICIPRECWYIFIQNPNPQVITLGSRHQAPRLIPTRTDITYAIHLKSRYGHDIRIAGYINPSRPIPSSLILQPSTSLPNHPPTSEKTHPNASTNNPNRPLGRKETCHGDGNPTNHSLHGSRQPPGTN